MNAQQFKQARKAKGLTQQETAKFLKASYSAVTKWETGYNPIPDWVADKMRESSGRFILNDLTPDEMVALHKLAAGKGVSPESLIAALVRAGLKFGGTLLLAFLLFHAGRSGSTWTAKSLKFTASTVAAAAARLAI